MSASADPRPAAPPRGRIYLQPIVQHVSHCLAFIRPRWSATDGFRKVTCFFVFLFCSLWLVHTTLHSSFWLVHTLQARSSAAACAPQTGSGQEPRCPPTCEHRQSEGLPIDTCIVAFTLWSLFSLYLVVSSNTTVPHTTAGLAPSRVVNQR
jgi:hypothetical protein